MTEIQFLVSLMMDHKLPPAVKDKLIARIGEVEAKMGRPQGPPAQVFIPSARMPQADISIIEPAGTIPPMQPRQIVKQEVITSAGNGTSVRGPRKF